MKLLILLLFPALVSAQIRTDSIVILNKAGAPVRYTMPVMYVAPTGTDSIVVRSSATGKRSLIPQSTFALSNHTHNYLVAADIAGKVTGGNAYLTSNFTTTSVIAVSTNLTFAIAANEKYVVDIEGTCSKAVSNTGLKFAIAAPAGCTISGVQYGGGATLVAPVPSVISAINTLGATLATGIGVTVPFRIHVTVINSSTAGNITLQCASVTSNTATVYAGASMVYYKATGL